MILQIHLKNNNWTVNKPGKHKEIKTRKVSEYSWKDDLQMILSYKVAVALSEKLEVLVNTESNITV